MIITPFVLEIMLHHYVSPEPFRTQAAGYRDVRDKLIRYGMIMKDENGGGYHATEVGIMYIELLQKVKFPVMKWVEQEEE